MLNTLSNKIFITLLWYVYPMARNKLLIILTNLTGSYLECYVFRQMFCPVDM